MHARLLCGVSAAVIAISAGAFAQTTPAAQQTAAVSLSEVIVTAQKREQRLADVPVAVSVIGAQQLQQLGAHSIKDITLLTPGFNATTNASEATTTVRIRGIGSVADNAGLEDAVGIYIDGVYRPRNGVGYNSLGELNDIEVLKGPQGTLFGKNTVAGVVQINTLRPSFTFGAQAEADFQNYNGYNLSGEVTGPIVKDVLAGRLFFQDVSRDGYIPVLTSEPAGRLPNVNDEHFWTIRGQLLYAPRDDFKLTVIADYTERKDHCCVAVGYQNGLPAEILNILFPGSVIDPVARTNTTAVLNFRPFEHIRDEGISAQIDWKTPWLNNAEFTSITEVRDWRDAASTDTDYTGADLLNTTPDNVTNFKQFSEELRYAGQDGRLSWLVGAFFGVEDLNVFAPLSFGDDFTEYASLLFAAAGPLAPSAFPGGNPFPPGTGARDAYHQSEHSESIFTQEDFKILDNLILTGGIRFTSEHKSLVSNYANTDNSGACAYFMGVATGLGLPLTKATLPIQCLNNPAFFGLNTFQSFTESDVTGTVKLTYRINDSAMVYGSYSRGNLAAGFNLAEVTTAVGPNPNASLTPDPNTFFPAEYVNAFEVGSKVELLNRRLLLTAAAFYQKYQNFQLNAFTGTEFVESTIPDAISEGIETEDYWRVSPDLNLNLGVTYANTIYPNSLANQQALGNNVPGSPLFQATPLFLLPGSHPSFAPVWSIVGGFYFQHDIVDGLRFTANTNVKYQSSYNTGSDHDPVKDQRGYALVDGRVGIGSVNGRWSLELWATNLFNQHYHQAAFDGVLQTFSVPQPASIPALNNYDVFPYQPRFWGGTIRVKY
ncbi:MAG TPA: TonB-dependent receptor [Caulobacteraceae bacterium]|jgi:outer membrane receptor protein involved in Fe transport